VTGQRRSRLPWLVPTAVTLAVLVLVAAIVYSIATGIFF
jgi:hypothetical protein